MINDDLNADDTMECYLFYLSVSNKLLATIIIELLNYHKNVLYNKL